MRQRSIALDRQPRRALLSSGEYFLVRRIQGHPPGPKPRNRPPSNALGSHSRLQFRLGSTGLQFAGPGVVAGQGLWQGRSVELTFERSQQPQLDRKGRPSGVEFAVRAKLQASGAELEALEKYGLAHVRIPDPRSPGSEVQTRDVSMRELTSGVQALARDAVSLEVFCTQLTSALSTRAQMLQICTEFNGSRTISLPA